MTERPQTTHFTGKRRLSGWKISLAGHGVAVLVLVAAGLFKGCATDKPAEELIFVEFTVAVPPAAEPVPDPAPDPTPPEPEPEPEPPPPEPEPIPEPTPEPPKPPPPPPPKKPDPPPPPPKPPEPPKKKPVASIRQTNRVTRSTGPQLTDEQIRKLLNQGAKPGAVTSIPDDVSQRELGKWFNDVERIMKAGWRQPRELGTLPGMECIAEVEVDASGHISNAHIIGSSYNATMDRSVQDVLDRRPALPKPPGGARKFTITYKLVE